MRTETFTPDSHLFEEFRSFAARLYEGDPAWTHPADPLPAMSPLCFVVRDGDGAIVARACSTQVIGESALRLGWYECVEGQHAAGALLDAVRDQARRLGLPSVIGPINGTTWHRYRFADPSEAPPFFLDVHNKPWYAAQWSAAGATEIASYFSTSFEALGGYDDHDRHVAEQRERGITLRQVDVTRFDDELRLIHELSTAGFRENYLYTPITAEEFIALYRPVLPLVRPEHVLIAQTDDGAAVGFVFAIDNILARDRRSLVMKSAAVLPERAGRGLGHLLLETVHRSAADAGYEQIIHALVHRDNRSGRILSERSAPYRTYRLYSIDA